MKLLKLVPLVLMAQAFAAMAQDSSSAGGAAPAWNEPTGEKMEALRLKGDAARGAEEYALCRGCHKPGATGSASGAYPRLAGQHATVLIKQLSDIRGGLRTNRRMLPFADGHVLDIQTIADIAAYLQALPFPANLGRGPGDAPARGGELYARDCATCHGDAAEGQAGKFYPLLAGQHFRYLRREVRDIKSGKRGNANPEMAKVIQSYNAADVEAVADYISRLAPPRKSSFGR